MDRTSDSDSDNAGSIKRTPIKQRKRRMRVSVYPGAHPVFCGGSAGGRFNSCLPCIAKPKGSTLDVVVNANATESTQATEETFQVDANESLQRTDYTVLRRMRRRCCLLSSIATPISAKRNELHQLFSRYGG